MLKYKDLDEDEQNNIKNFCDNCFSEEKLESQEWESDSYIFYEKENNEIIGLVGMMNNQTIKELLKKKGIKDTSPYILLGNEGLFIYNLSVKKSCRKRGIGKNLVKKCIDYINNSDYKYLYSHVHDSNIGSCNIFKYNNFKKHKSYKDIDNRNVICFFYI